MVTSEISTWYQHLDGFLGSVSGNLHGMERDVGHNAHNKLGGGWEVV